MMHKAAVVAAILGLIASPAFADKPDKHAKDKQHDGHAGEVEVTFNVQQRDLIRGYIVETHGRGHCPPGLAKKDNGCLPPGQAKKLYVVGQPLPPNVVLVELPRPLHERLGPPPPGYRYAMVDGDVVKLSLANRLVVDVVEALVN